jgi:DNA polymerase III delta prime subunit
MADNINLTLNEDEAEMIVDALEADMEGYIEAAKEAADSGNKADVDTFSEAAERIQGLISRIQPLVG